MKVRKKSEQFLEFRLQVETKKNTVSVKYWSSCKGFFFLIPYIWNNIWNTLHTLIASTGCECNNKADRCYFDEDLYQTTGRGGHCIDCRDNTDGPHCERCKDNHYLKPDDRRCTPCECNPTGKTDPKSQSVILQVKLIPKSSSTG